MDTAKDSVCEITLASALSLIYQKVTDEKMQLETFYKYFGKNEEGTECAITFDTSENLEIQKLFPLKGDTIRYGVIVGTFKAELLERGGQEAVAHAQYIRMYDEVQKSLEHLSKQVQSLVNKARLDYVSEQITTGRTVASDAYGSTLNFTHETLSSPTTISSDFSKPR